MSLSLYKPKIIYYYQSFSTLTHLVTLNLPNVHIYISSLHFGKDIKGNPYLHLNNSTPQSQTGLWIDIENAYSKGITIMTMLGGAGGAYTTLFNDFDIYYPLLLNFLKTYPFIKGIDLDIEEYTSLENVKYLIRQLVLDMGNEFIITMAPLAYSLTADGPGMGGFSYKDLWQSQEGKYISWFNVQCYGCFDYETFNQMVLNGYPPHKLVMGMLGDDYNIESFGQALDELNKITQAYPQISGCDLWEFGDSHISPLQWGSSIKKCLFTYINLDIFYLFWVYYFCLWTTFFLWSDIAIFYYYQRLN
jgi:hypothetical protein